MNEKIHDRQRREELADFLRTRRARLSPTDVGLPMGSRRRTPGLRREEVAELADVGLAWYTWLEQARDIRASAEVAERLAGSLQLDATERSHLFRLAGHPLPSALLSPEEAAAPALQRMLDNFTLSASYIVGRRWDILAWNAAAADIFGDFGQLPPGDRNGIWLTFTSAYYRRLFVDWKTYAQTALAQFRVDCDQAADDPHMQELVERLKGASPEFAAWWPRHEVRPCANLLKTLNHPSLGRIVLEHASFHVTGHPHLRLVVHTRIP